MEKINPMSRQRRFK